MPISKTDVDRHFHGARAVCLHCAALIIGAKKKLEDSALVNKCRSLQHLVKRELRAC